MARKRGTQEKATSHQRSGSGLLKGDLLSTVALDEILMASQCTSKVAEGLPCDLLGLPWMCHDATEIRKEKTRSYRGTGEAKAIEGQTD